MKSKKYDKLVRDKIPDIVHGEGSVCVFEVATEDTIGGYVRAKIHEEAFEVCDYANTKEQIKEELADLLAVMIKFGEINGIKSHEILSAMVEKEQRCGKFDNNFILKEIRTDD